jgi:hypothetical protein
LKRELIFVAKKSRNDSKEKKGPKKSKRSVRKEKSLKDQKPSKIEVETEKKEPKKGEKDNFAFEGPICGNPSLIQSNFGIKGNFELVVPLSNGGLAQYWRDNDSPNLSWYGPIKFGEDSDKFNSSSLIQSRLGEIGNLELVAIDASGNSVAHFWRDSGPSFDWHGPNYISEPSKKSLFCGNPTIIQSRFGHNGNFDLVVPLAKGGLAHFWRDNDDPTYPWYGPFTFGSDVKYEAATLIQSNFGEPGNLELIARSNDKIVFFWRDSKPEYQWNGPFILDQGIAGCPSMIQSKFGQKGNFEMVTPLAFGGLGHYWRDNDDENLCWHGPLMFGTRLSKIDSVTLIQSNFGTPGCLELVANVGGELAFFWRDSGPDLRWNGPFFPFLM